MKVYYRGLWDDVKDNMFKKEWFEIFDVYIEMVINIDNFNYEGRLEKKGEGYVSCY